MRILICGATGSIGKQTVSISQTLDCQIVGITYNTQHETAKQIIKQLKIPYYFCHSDPNKGNVKNFIELIKLTKPQMIINAVVGIAGLSISWQTLKAKIDLGLANKESLVVAGHWLKALAKHNKVNIYPIDSEHSGLFELVKNLKKNSIKNLIITASGGPFWGFSNSQLKNVTVKQALAHPTWKMGNKISIDSATMVNKAFEMIEAYHLFNTKNIIAIRNKQSLIHAGVQLTDNSVLLHASTADMRLPIALCLKKFKSNDSIIKPLDFSNLTINLESIKESDYPVLKIARNVMNKPQTTCGLVFNIANEFAINLFLQQKIRFDQIATLIVNFYNNYHHQKIKEIVTIFGLINKIQLLLQNSWKDYL